MAYVNTCVWRRIYPYLPRATALENAVAYVRCTMYDGGRRSLPMYDVRCTMYDVRCTIAIIARFARDIRELFPAPHHRV